VPGYLKGDLIYFPHDGPAAAVLGIEDRAAWIREMGAMQFVLAGEECGADRLHQWMQATNVVRARPEVCFNHLRARRRLEVACGGRTADFEEPLPTFETLAVLLAGMERELAGSVGKLSPMAMDAERIARFEASDIASVRAEVADLAAGRHTSSGGHAEPDHDEDAAAPAVTHCAVWSSELTGQEAKRQHLATALSPHGWHAFQKGMSVWYRDPCDVVVAATVSDELPSNPFQPRRRRYAIETEAGEQVNVFAGQLRPWSCFPPTAETWDDVEVFAPPCDIAAAGDVFGFDDEGRPCVLEDGSAYAADAHGAVGGGGARTLPVDAGRVEAYMREYVQRPDADGLTPRALKASLAHDLGARAGHEYTKEWFWQTLLRLLASGGGDDGHEEPQPRPVAMRRAWIRLLDPAGEVHITPALVYGEVQVTGSGRMFDVCIDSDQRPLHMAHVRLRAYDVGAWSNVPPQPCDWGDHRPFDSSLLCGAAGLSATGKAATPSRLVARASNPVSEFDTNGLQLMRSFRSVFPLMKWNGLQGEEAVYGPWRHKGSISDTCVRHLLRQFTAAAAHTPALLFVLANQKQRHEALRACKARVPRARAAEYLAVVQHADFSPKVQRALKDPTCADARELERTLLPLLHLSGSKVPWSRLERGAVVQKMLALTRRHSAPSVFYTVSVDDVHQSLSIRLSHASGGNGDACGLVKPPSEATWERAGLRREAAALDTDGYDDLLRILRGEFDGDPDALPTSAAANASGWCRELRALSRSGREARLQRLAADNPVATSETYQRIVDATHTILFGLPDTRCRKGCTRNKGIFGVPTAHIHVTETSGRKALHVHGALWVSMAPQAIAGVVRDDVLFGKVAAALETQLCTAVDWEVHIVHRAQRAMGRKVAARRNSFQPPFRLDTPAGAQQAAFAAVEMGDHVHKDTCHKPPSGCLGCRGGYPKPHPLHACTVVQLVEHGGEDDRAPLAQFPGRLLPATQRWFDPPCHNHQGSGLPSHDGEAGLPPHCGGKDCSFHWPSQAPLEPVPRGGADIALVQPREWPHEGWLRAAGMRGQPGAEVEVGSPQAGAPSNFSPQPDVPSFSEVATLWPQDPRLLAMEQRRPPVTAQSSAAVRAAAAQQPGLADEAAELDDLLAEEPPDDPHTARALFARVLAFPPVASLLAHRSLERLCAELETATDADVAKVLKLWCDVGCANSNLVDFSEVLTTCTGSNTAPYFLGCGQGTLVSLWYLVKYFSKDSVKLSTSLSVVVQAHMHNEKYKGGGLEDASDQERALRKATRLLQRSVNKLDMELSITQAAMLLLGHQADGSSETFVQVHPWGVVQYADELLAHAAGTGTGVGCSVPVCAADLAAGRSRAAEQGSECDEADVADSDADSNGDLEGFVTGDSEEDDEQDSDRQGGDADYDEESVDHDDWYMRVLSEYDPRAGADDEDEDDVDMDDASVVSNEFVDAAACESGDEFGTPSPVPPSMPPPSPPSSPPPSEEGPGVEMNAPPPSSRSPLPPRPPPQTWTHATYAVHVVPNVQVDAEAAHATSTNLGLAADAVAQADYDMASVVGSERMVAAFVDSDNLQDVAAWPHAAPHLVRATNALHDSGDTPVVEAERPARSAGVCVSEWTLAHHIAGHTAGHALHAAFSDSYAVVLHSVPNTTAVHVVHAVLCAFRDMGATDVQLEAEAARLRSDGEYFACWCRRLPDWCPGIASYQRAVHFHIAKATDGMINHRREDGRLLLRLPVQLAGAAQPHAYFLQLLRALASRRLQALARGWLARLALRRRSAHRRSLRLRGSGGPGAEGVVASSQHNVRQGEQGEGSDEGPCFGGGLGGGARTLRRREVVHADPASLPEAPSICFYQGEAHGDARLVELAWYAWMHPARGAFADAWVSLEERAALPTHLGVVVTYVDFHGGWLPTTVATMSATQPGEWGYYTARALAGGESIGVMLDTRPPDGPSLYLVDLHGGVRDAARSRPGGPKRANDPRSTGLPANAILYDNGWMAVRPFADIQPLRPALSHTQRRRREILVSYGIGYWERRTALGVAASNAAALRSRGAGPAGQDNVVGGEAAVVRHCEQRDEFWWQDVQGIAELPPGDALYWYHSSTSLVYCRGPTGWIAAPWMMSAPAPAGFPSFGDALMWHLWKTRVWTAPQLPNLERRYELLWFYSQFAWSAAVRRRSVLAVRAGRRLDLFPGIDGMVNHRREDGRLLLRLPVQLAGAVQARAYFLQLLHPLASRRLQALARGWLARLALRRRSAHRRSLRLRGSGGPGAEGASASSQHDVRQDEHCEGSAEAPCFVCNRLARRSDPNVLLYHDLERIELTFCGPRCFAFFEPMQDHFEDAKYWGCCQRNAWAKVEARDWCVRMLRAVRLFRGAVCVIGRLVLLYRRAVERRAPGGAIWELEAFWRDAAAAEAEAGGALPVVLHLRGAGEGGRTTDGGGGDGLGDVHDEPSALTSTDQRVYRTQHTGGSLLATADPGDALPAANSTCATSTGDAAVPCCTDAALALVRLGDEHVSVRHVDDASGPPGAHRRTAEVLMVELTGGWALPHCGVQATGDTPGSLFGPTLDNADTLALDAAHVLSRRLLGARLRAPYVPRAARPTPSSPRLVVCSRWEGELQFSPHVEWRWMPISTAPGGLDPYTAPLLLVLQSLDAQPASSINLPSSPPHQPVHRSSHAPPVYVMLEGNVGAGKTTLLARLAAALQGDPGVVCMAEPVDLWREHGLLQRFYAGSLSPLAFQLVVLPTVAAPLARALHRRRVRLVITERSLRSNLSVFAEHNLDGQDAVAYRVAHAAMISGLPAHEPVTVWLDTPPAVCAARALARARPEEHHLNAAFFQALHDKHCALASTTTHACHRLDGTADVPSLAQQLLAIVNQLANREGNVVAAVAPAPAGAVNIQTLAERHPLPADAHLHFEAAGHIYHVHGQRVPQSATSLVASCFPAFDAAAVVAAHYSSWRHNKASPYHRVIRDVHAAGGADGDAALAIRQGWLVRGQAASSLGTSLHSYCEHVVNGLPVSSPCGHEREAAQFAQLLQGQTELGTVVPFRTELIVAHRCGGRVVCAGQIDALFRNAAGDLLLVDYKRTCKHSALRPDAIGFDGACGVWPVEGVADTPFQRYSLQVSLYAVMLLQTHMIDVGDRLFIVCMHPEQPGPQVVRCRDLRAEAHTLLALQSGDAAPTSPCRVGPVGGGPLRSYPCQEADVNVQEEAELRRLEGGDSVPNRQADASAHRQRAPLESVLCGVQPLLHVQQSTFSESMADEYHQLLQWGEAHNAAYDEELGDMQTPARPPGRLGPTDDVPSDDLQADVPLCHLRSRHVLLEAPLHYRYRGDELRGCSFMAYTMCVMVVDRAEKHALSGDTNRPACCIHFAEGHPERGVLIQVLRRKIVCPMHAGSAPPRLPAPHAKGGTPSDEWKKRRRRAIRYMVHTFIPWDGDTPRLPTLETLHQFLTYPALTVVRPAGHGFGAVADPVAYLPNLVATFSVRLLLQHMQDVHVSHHFKLLNGAYRFRCRSLWTAAQREAYDALQQREAALAQATSATTEDLKAMQAARMFDKRRVADALRAEQWADQLDAQISDALPASIARVQAAPHTVWANYVEQISPWAGYSDAELQELHGRMRSASEATSLTASPPSVDQAYWATQQPPTARDLEPLPAAFAPLSDEAKAAALEQYHAGTGPPPLGDQQLDVLSGLYKAVRLAGWHQKSGIGRDMPRSEYAAQASAQAAQLQVPLCYFLQGAPGTGKTELLRTLQRWMADEDLGIVAFSAYTGVAVTALPAPAATYCTFFGIGTTTGAKGFADVKPTQQATFERILGGSSSRLTVLVLDEFSFVNVSQIGYLDKRLRQLLECTEPFGGLVVVLVGDAHQLPSINGMGLHTALVVDALSSQPGLARLVKGRTDGDDTSGAHARGLALLRRAHRLPVLSEQHRTPDVAHARRLTALRDAGPESTPVTMDLINAFVPLTAEAITREGEALRFAKVGVIGNRERHMINTRQARAFGAHHHRVMFEWKLPLSGQAAGWLNDEEKEELYRHEPGMWGRFVHGAPAVINHNVGTDRGLVNGAAH
jgi:thymidylate kinase